MRFCTTCGRTYEDDSMELCPYDSTPLFDMAGGVGAFAEGELPADNEAAGGLFGKAKTAEPKESVEAPVITPTSEPEPAPSPVIAAAPEPIEPKLEDLSAPVEPSAPAPQVDPLDELPAPSSQRQTGSLAASDLFGESEGEEEAPVKPNPQERAVSAAAALQLPEADDAASIRIAANIKNAIEEIGGADSSDDAMSAHKPVTAHISSAYDQLPEPSRDLRPPAGADSSRAPAPARSPLVPILIAVVLLAVAGAAFYFLAGPGAVQPSADPPKVEPPAKPVEPVEQPVKPVEEPTKPKEEPTEPVKPKEEPAKPNMAAPAEEPTKPVEEPAKPKEEPTGPAKPKEEPAKPKEPKEPTKPKEPKEPKEPTKPKEEPKEPAKPKEEPAKPKEPKEPKEPTKPKEEPKEPAKPKEEEALDRELDKMLN
jgi:hypothetical protein